MKSSFVLYSVVLVLALGILGNLVTALISQPEQGPKLSVAISLLLFVCLFAVLFNYERLNVQGDVERALLKKIKQSWLEILNDLERVLPGKKALDLPTAWFKNSPSGKGSSAQSPTPNVVQAFEQGNRALLILGKSGSGKTISLLKVARHLVQLAEADPTQSIPVLFNLSSFEERSLGNWVLSELKNKYGISEQMGGALLLQRRIILLLDGLDEARCASRCADAISEFLRNNQHAEIVVTCTASAERAALRTNLPIIKLVDLDDESFSKFAKEAGYDVDDEELSKAKKRSSCKNTPVMFGFASATSQNLDGDLDAIVFRRLKSANGLTPLFRDTQVFSGLQWLAEASRRQYRTQFAISDIQQTWIGSSFGQRLYMVLSRVLGAAIVMFLGGGLLKLSDRVLDWIFPGNEEEIFSMLGIEEHYWSWMLITIVVGGVMAAAVDCGHLRYKERIGKTDPELKYFSKRKKAISLGIYMISFFLAFFLFALILVGQPKALVGSLMFSLAFGVVFWFRSLDRTITNDTTTADKLVWSRVSIFEGLAWGLFGGTVAGIVGPILLLWQHGGSFRFDTAVLLLLIGAMSGAIAGGLRRISIVDKQSATDGIKMSLRSMAMIWMSVGAPTVLLIWGYTTVVTGNSALGLGGGMFYGLGLGMLFCFTYAGFDIVYRIALRVTLTLLRRAPLLNYEPFLDYAVSLGFLRKVGGGYVFYHKLVRDCFEPPNNLSKLKSRYGCEVFEGVSQPAVNI